MKLSTNPTEDRLGYGPVVAVHTFLFRINLSYRECCILLKNSVPLLHAIVSLLRLFLFKKYPSLLLPVEPLHHSSKHISNLYIIFPISLSSLEPFPTLALSLLQNLEITETYNRL